MAMLLNNQMVSILKKPSYLGWLVGMTNIVGMGYDHPPVMSFVPQKIISSGSMKVSCWDVSKWYTIWLFNGLPWKNPPCY